MKFPIGIQSFERLREDGYVYVDKTDLAYKLVNTFSTVFLGRPRRFGKSLLMSTLHAYFQGRRDLFQGLAIERLESDWIEHPVLHFDLNTGDYHNNGMVEIERVLNYQLEQYEAVYGGRADTLANRFLNVIKSAYEQTGQTVVVLIDEYDKPMLATMDVDDRTEESMRSALRSFYGCLKTYSKYLRFVMLTGVSKFGKLSVFSDLNNIKDVSFLPDYAGICGITQDEIRRYFPSAIAELADSFDVESEQMIELLRKKYDGYRFTKRDLKVFNPYSLFNALADKELKDYWFESGTPAFLAKMLQANDYDLSEIEGIRVNEESLYKVDNISAIPLLYQSGYLTIKEYDQSRNRCILGYPNQEVEAGFLDFLLPYYTNVKHDRSINEIDHLVEVLQKGHVKL